MAITAEHSARTATARLTGGQILPSRRNAWPLLVLVAAFPLWWLLGLSALLPLALAVPMLIQLLRNGRVRVPRGTGWWFLFLIWVVVSVITLWADAPGAVPGGGGAERLLVFLYRLAWYGTCTIAFLWIGNAREEDASTRRVTGLLGWMFVFTVAGGVLGMLAPKFELTSLVEILLPNSLTTNSFIHPLVHPEAATLTTFLGREEYRPIAPFEFANSWGSNFSMYLPFFLITWFGRAAAWKRLLAPIILVVAAFPVVYSMNRGLWASLGVGAAALIVYLIAKRRMRALVASLLVLGIGATIFVGSPLGAFSAERLENAHSNDRRTELLIQTVTSTLEGSPILGFGSTRDVKGSFSSIAGGGRPDCDACQVPPLGTQGHIWLVIFSQGLVGMCFFLLFFISRFRAHWRSRTPLEFAAIVILLFFAIQMFVYDTLGMPFFTIMLTLGMVWRQRRSAGAENDVRPLGDFTRYGRRYLPLLLIGTLAGTAAGAALAAARPVNHEASLTLLLAPSPVYLTFEGTEDPRSGRMTIDTEAALVLSRSSIDPVAKAEGITDAETVRSRVGISAIANSQVLTLSYSGSSPEQATRTVTSLAQAYLAVRSEGLKQRRDQVLLVLRDRLARLQVSIPPSAPLSANGQIQSSYASEVSANIRAAVVSLSATSTVAGEIIREPRTRAVRGQPEVDVASAALLGFLAATALAIAIAFVRSFRSDDGRRRWLINTREEPGPLIREYTGTAGWEGEKRLHP
jgi:capsular polysaccharide biosynthesis protein